jgi:hypothetical protein
MSYIGRELRVTSAFAFPDDVGRPVGSSGRSPRIGITSLGIAGDRDALARIQRERLAGRFLRLEGD